MGFFSRKKTSEKENKKTEETIVNKEELLKKAEELKAQLESDSDKEEKIKLLNEIGSCYFQADDSDNAIIYYEQSLEIDKQLGKAYTDLLKLYNKKRQEAAEARDDEKMQYYLDKVQDVMQMSKDVLRGKI